MEFRQIRELAIIGMFSDDALFDILVLKGGNALSLIHRIGARASLDLDFSMPGDFDDLGATRDRVFAVLKDRFGSAGYTVFDERLDPRPPDRNTRWGGYIVEFKLIQTRALSRVNGRSR